MQLNFSLLEPSLTNLESAISPARLQRFMGATGCRNAALRTCIWNSRLCAELYFPLQTAEICVRNAISGTLSRRFTRTWFDGQSVQNLLTEKYRTHLAEVVSREKASKGASFDENHVISGLSFGFWVNLMTSRYKHHLWQQGIPRTFLHAPVGLTLKDAHKKIDQLRVFRNKVAHHYAIYDRSPTAEYANLLEIVGWVCPTTQGFIKQMSNPAKVLVERPA